MCVTKCKKFVGMFLQGTVAEKARLKQVFLNFRGGKGTHWVLSFQIILSSAGEKGWKYSRVYEPRRGAVMLLMEEVEQRVRSPQHLCGRLMTIEPREGKTVRKRDSETGERCLTALKIRATRPLLRPS